jgi:hypothetical protein
MMTTVPQDDFTDVQSLTYNLDVDSGVGGGTNIGRIRFSIDASGASWSYDPTATQYVQDLIEEGLAAMNAKIATDYPLKDTYPPYFTIVVTKDF